LGSSVAVCLDACVRARFPSHILVIPQITLASDGQRSPVPNHRLNPFAIDLLNHSYALTEDRHAVASPEFPSDG
jgi:hypothetical protein